ncbi:S24 family peptidase [Sphingomonas bacterium]|uniref:S24 family peptidase n=1 Tax=Sphingomonas bacterium TaxID=1895847 RepID=UPI001575585F|nr:S24 family peptidase [Sphingomonas bacterium]
MKLDDPRAVLAALVAASEGESLSSLSRLLGRNDAYLQQFVRRGTPRRLAEGDRALLARYFGVAEAVLGGREIAPGPMPVRVPRLDARASAGPGALNDGERPVDAIDFPPRLLRSLGVRGGPVALIEARGDSMAPGIADGDQLLVDQGDTRVTGRGGVFVVRIDGATLVKRVARRGGAVVATSDNPASPPVGEGVVEVIGRVVWQSRAVA